METFCSKCGIKYELKALFCSHCGLKRNNVLKQKAKVLPNHYMTTMNDERPKQHTCDEFECDFLAEKKCITCNKLLCLKHCYIQI